MHPRLGQIPRQPLQLRPSITLKDIIIRTGLTDTGSRRLSIQHGLSGGEVANKDYLCLRSIAGTGTNSREIVGSGPRRGIFDVIVARHVFGYDGDPVFAIAANELEGGC